MLPDKLTNDVFDNLKWKEVDGKELDKIIEGMQIIGSEPCDYPLTDEVTIYIKDKNNNIYALSIGYDDLTDEGQNPFFINIAEVGKE